MRSLKSFQKSLVTTMSSLVALSSANVAIASTHTDDKSFPEISGVIRYFQESFRPNHVGKVTGKNAIEFETLPEAELEIEWSENISTNFQLEIDNFDGNGLTDWDNRGVRLNRASVVYSDNDFSLEFGKLQEQRGVIWWEALPFGHPPLFSEEVSFALTVEDQVGIKISNHFNIESGISAFAAISASRLVSELNGSFGHRSTGPEGELTDSDEASLITRFQLIKTDDKDRLTLGMEASRLAAGKDSEDNEYSLGAHMLVHQEYCTGLTHDFMAEVTRVWNHEGYKEDDVTVATIYNQLTQKVRIGPVSAGLHTALAANRDFNAAWSNSLEAGIAFPLSRRFTAYASGGLDYFYDGPFKGLGASWQVGAQLKF